MKILEIIPTIGPGGAEALVCDLAIYFAGKGAQVKLFLLGGVRGERGAFLQDKLKSVGVEILGINVRKTSSIQNVLSISKLLRSWKPDIVHCHLYTSAVACALGWFLAFKRSSIIVRTLHNTEIVGRRSQVISFFLTKFFDYDVACSDSVEKQYLKFIGMEKSKKVLTIQNGCFLSPRNVTSEEKSIARNDFDFPPNSFIVVHVGRFDGASLSGAQKGHDILLKSFSDAFQGEKNVLLVCAGDGPLRKKAEGLAVRLGVNEQTIFLGNIPEIWQLLKAADVFVMPSRHEGLPLTLLEAVSVGIVIVASDIPEICSLNHRDHWLLQPVDDHEKFSVSLKMVRKSFDRYSKIAKTNSDLFREMYSIDTCGQNYWNFFQMKVKNIDSDD